MPPTSLCGWMDVCNKPVLINVNRDIPDVGKYHRKLILSFDHCWVVCCWLLETGHLISWGGGAEIYPAPSRNDIEEIL